MIVEQTDLYTLHLDEQTVELMPGLNLDKLADSLATAMADGSVVRVPAQLSTLDDHMALVRPAQAKVVYVSHQSVVVPRIGKPSD